MFDLEHAIQSTLWGEPETAAEAESWQGLGTKVYYTWCFCHHVVIVQPYSVHVHGMNSCLAVGEAFSNSLEVATMSSCQDAAALAVTDQEKADMHMRRWCAGSQEAGRQGTEGEGAGVLAAQGQERCRRCLWRQGSCQVTQLHRTMSLHQAIHTSTHGVRSKPYHVVGHYVSAACPIRSILWQYS